LDRSAPHFEAFRKGLIDLGYVEGRNIAIEPRFAEGQYERFPDLLAELVHLKVDVIAVAGAVTARAANKAVKDIPIVFAVVVDPVADNVVPNLEHPGGTSQARRALTRSKPRSSLNSSRKRSLGSGVWLCWVIEASPRI
jgi:putative ABC transport system substrate-binding protein